MGRFSLQATYMLQRHKAATQQHVSKSMHPNGAMGRMGDLDFKPLTPCKGTQEPHSRMSVKASTPMGLKMRRMTGDGNFCTRALTLVAWLE